MLTTPNQIEENALNRIISQRIQINWEFAAWVAILLLALFTRFYMLDQRVMSHDESLHTRFSYNLYNEGNFVHTPLMHGPVLFHATAFSFFLFGDGDFSGRLYTAALGVLMVMFPLLWRRWLGRWGALLASLMILISPLLMYYNRYIRHDTPSILFGMIMAHCILMYLNGPPKYRRRGFWLYVFAAAMILNLGSKETAFIYIAVFGSFLCIYFLVRLAQHRYDWRGKPLLYSLMLSILLGGVMTLGMFIIIDIVPVEIVPGRGTSWGDLSGLHRSSFLSWTLLTLLAELLIPACTALFVFRDRLNRLPRREITLVFLIAVVVAAGLLYIEELSHVPSVTETAQPSIPDVADAAAETAPPGQNINWLPIAPLWLLLIIGAPWLIRDARRSVMADNLASNGKGRPGLWGFLYQFPEVDFIVLMGTLILPWTTAVFPRLMGGGSAELSGLAQSMPNGLYNLVAGLPGLGGPEEVGRFLLGLSAFVPLFSLMLVVGLTWNWRRWLVASGIFHVLFAFFFTTVFTNIAGLATGMVYSLGYWLEQQGVRRGSQPQYYYLLIILPVYEYLPIVGSIAAMFAGVMGFWRMRRGRLDQPDAEREENALGSGEHTGSATILVDNDAAAASTRYRTLQIDADASDHGDGYLRRLPFLLLLAWWAILNLVGYSLAGEKMPWLGTHLTTPMIFLAAWYFGGVFSRIDKVRFLSRGWLALLIMPVFLISLAHVIGAYLIGDPPFVGLSQAQLERTYEWLASLLIALILGYLLARIARHAGWIQLRRIVAVAVFGILSTLTWRAAWMASFVNYDLATEFLVYAHSAPAVKWVLEDIDEMSQRLTDGKDLKFAYDDEVSWPYSWYFRDFTAATFVGGNPTMQNLDDAIFVVVGSGHRGDVEPILEDRYFRRDYTRMWWPMQEYFNLTPERILNALDFSPDNRSAAEIRRGMFDIWWSRDYDRYGDATNRDFSLTNWPVSDRMHVYVRKDFAAQIWAYGLGEGAVASELPVEINLCASNWQQLSPLLEFSTAGQPLAQPIGLSASNGLIYVADESRNQVLVFADDGQQVRTVGGDGALNFVRPNSVTALANGEILVVDTWNYQIRHIDAAGHQLAQWGSPGEFGFDAPRDPVDGFWGPRDVVINSDGMTYVSDTGNKRIRVYQLQDGEAEYRFDIGRGGSGPGELDEPSGLALHSDGRLFVADTWNRRISVFDSAGSHLLDFRVRGWYSSTFNRPYLAMDEERGLLYVTDPDSNRVLIYLPDGECVGSFGQEGTIGANGQIQAIAGIAVDDAGFVYISDSAAGKVFKFPPFPAQAIPAG